MFNTLIQIILYLVAVGVCVPFAMVALGVGSEEFRQAGWIIPMLSLYIGIPVIVFLLVLEMMVRMYRKIRGKRVDAE